MKFSFIKHFFITSIAFFTMIPYVMASFCTVQDDGTHKGHGYNQNIKWIDMDEVIFDFQTRKLRGEAFFDGGIIAFDHKTHSDVSVIIGDKKNDGTYLVSGQAFSPQIGWIFFDDSLQNKRFEIIVNTDGYLQGKAWNENVGWIFFDKDTMGGDVTYQLDVTPPEVSFIDGVSANFVQKDTITLDLDDAKLARWRYHNPLTDGDTCSQDIDDYRHTLSIESNGTSSFEITSEEYNGRSICVYVEDPHCNFTTKQSAHTLHIDNTPPQIVFNDDFEGKPVLKDTIQVSWDDAVIQKATLIDSTDDPDSSGRLLQNITCPTDPSVYQDFLSNERWTQSDLANNGKYLCLYGEDSSGNTNIVRSRHAIDITILEDILINGKSRDQSYLQSNINEIRLISNTDTSGTVYYWFDPLGKNVGYDNTPIWNTDKTAITRFELVDSSDQSMSDTTHISLSGERQAVVGQEIIFDIKLPGSNMGQSGIDNYRPHAPHLDGVGVLHIKLPGENARSFNVFTYTRGRVDPSSTRPITGSIWAPGAGYITLKDAHIQAKGINRGAIFGYGWSANVGHIFIEHPSLQHQDQAIPMLYIDPYQANHFISTNEMQDKDGDPVIHISDITDYLRGEMYSPTLGIIRLAPDVPGDTSAKSVQSDFDGSSATGAALSLSHHFDTKPKDVNDQNSVSPAGFFYFDLGKNIKDIITSLDITGSRVKEDTIQAEYDFSDDDPTRMVHQYNTDHHLVPINRKKAFATDNQQQRQYDLIDLRLTIPGIFNDDQLNIIDDDYIKCPTVAARNVIASGTTQTDEAACTITSDGYGNFVITNLQISNIQADSSDDSLSKVLVNAPSSNDEVSYPNSDDPFIRNQLIPLTLEIDDNNGNVTKQIFTISNYEPILFVNKKSEYNDQSIRTSRNTDDTIKHTTVIRNIAESKQETIDYTPTDITLPLQIPVSDGETKNVSSLPIPLPAGVKLSDMLLRFGDDRTDEALPRLYVITAYDIALNELTDIQITLNPRPTGPLPVSSPNSDYDTLSVVCTNGNDDCENDIRVNCPHDDTDNCDNNIHYITVVARSEATTQPQPLTVSASGVASYSFSLTNLAYIKAVANHSIDQTGISENAPIWADIEWLGQDEDREYLRDSDIVRDLTLYHLANKGRVVIFGPDGDDPKLVYFNDIAHVSEDQMQWTLSYKKNYTVDWYKPDSALNDLSCNDLDPNTEEYDYQRIYDIAECDDYVFTPFIQDQSAISIEYEIPVKD